MDFCDVVDKRLVSNYFQRAASFRSGFFWSGNTGRYFEIDDLGSEDWRDIGMLKESPSNPTAPIADGDITLSLLRSGRGECFSGEVGQRLSATASANHLINPQERVGPDPERVIAIETRKAVNADAIATIVALGGEVPEGCGTVRTWEF